MRRLFVLVSCALLLFPATGRAQPRPAKLLLTVVDQTGAVIPNAEVTVVRADDPAKKLIGP